MRLLLLLFLAAACATTRASGPTDKKDIAHVLDEFHRAAAKADGDRYFGHLADDAVFLGTDPGERWSKAAFRAYAEPYFAQGVGWTYRPHHRHIVISVDGTIAWFDERLDNRDYGEVRGSGVLRRGPDGWKIVHYNLSFAVPNDVARDVVELIKSVRSVRGSKAAPR